ncbi:MAG: helix-turn-helix domain-containing protein [Oscillospiraceae bacterium]|nr:helix-turn-helix domain-containing protein [Oscillospiraceae bacterium]
MYSSVEIAQKIKFTAKSKNIIMKDMLAECGLSKNALSSMLSGGSTPKSENLARIADYLECSVDYLLGRTEEPKLETRTEIKQNNNNGINHGINAFMVTAPSEKQLDENQTELLKRFAMLSYAEKIEFMQKLIEKTEVKGNK